MRCYNAAMTKPCLKPKSVQTSIWFAIGIVVMAIGIFGGPQGNVLMVVGFFVAVFGDRLKRR